MHFTLSTLPLGLLALYLLHRSRWDFIAAGLFMSVFQAASVINIGQSIGVSASYLLILLGMLKSYVIPGQQDIQPRNKVTSGLILLFTAYALISALLFPVLFQGVLFTNSKFGERIPIHWETGHLNQLFYLFLCIALFFHITGKTNAKEQARFLNWYVGGNILACVIGFYQFFCLRTGLPFPSQFLHTNPVYGIFEAYDIGDFARINSTFSEAAAVAGSVTPALAIVLWRLVNQVTFSDLVAAVTLFTGLFLSISTTGYLMFGFLAVVTLLLYLQKLGGSRSNRILKLLLGASLMTFLLAIVAAPAFRDSAERLLDLVIFQKTSTNSYSQRTQWNMDGWQTGIDTYGLGAGWGMCRASSLLPTFFGNIGVPGFVLFTLILGRVFFPVWRSRASELRFKGEALLSASVFLVGQFIAGPEFTAPFIWAAMAIAVTRSVRPHTLQIQREEPLSMRSEPASLLAV